MRFLTGDQEYYVPDDKLQAVILEIAPTFLVDPTSEEAKKNMAERVILRGAIIPFKRLIKRYLPTMSWQGDLLGNLTRALVASVVGHLASHTWEIETIEHMDGSLQIVGLHPTSTGKDQSGSSQKAV